MKRVATWRWETRESDESIVAELSRCCGLSPLLARVLANRRVTSPETANRHLSATLADLHDPFLMLGMVRAAERLARAVQDGERVCVHGDYDVDGVTATALLAGFFRAIGMDCATMIPHRLRDGYDLTGAGVDQAAALGARLIVTVDCGITALEGARRCAELGIDLIVTDHHAPGDELPPALAILNPLQPGCPFPFKSLSGVGVAFNLLMALRNRLRSTGFFQARPEPNLREGLDLVALGTVADVVPLLDENRIFVRYGLAEMSGGDRIGLRALKDVAGLEGEIGCGDVGFRLAPRINAAGRIEDASLALELLLATDPARASDLARRLDEENAARQAIEQGILADALARVEAGPDLEEGACIVLASEQWHPGVVGIVASRLVDLYHRPAILVALKDGEGKGSGRSIPGFHLHEAIKACAGHLERFGGHRHAAGLTVAEDLLPSFTACFARQARERLLDEDLVPSLKVDAEIRPADLTLAMAESLAALGPFGPGNPEPLFVLAGMRVAEARVVRERHLFLRLEREGRFFEAMGFGMAERGLPAGEVDALVAVEWRKWNGRRFLRLRLKDHREAGFWRGGL